MANKQQIQEQIVRERLHEHSVKQFFKSVNVHESYIHYDNFKTFANAKNTIEFNTVTEKDVTKLKKFCRNWIITKGDVDAKRLRNIQSIIKYYAQKEHNYKCKQRRLQTRAVKKTAIKA